MRLSEIWHIGLGNALRDGVDAADVAPASTKAKCLNSTRLRSTLSLVTTRPTSCRSCERSSRESMKWFAMYQRVPGSHWAQLLTDF
jgi:hypothetical protein